MIHLLVHPTPRQHWDWINVLQQHKDLGKWNYFKEACALPLTQSWRHLSLRFLIYRIRPWANFADSHPASSHGPLCAAFALPPSAETGPRASWRSGCSNTDVRTPTGLENVIRNPSGDIMRINNSRREKHFWKSFLLSSQQLLLSFCLEITSSAREKASATSGADFCAKESGRHSPTGPDHSGHPWFHTLHRELRDFLRDVPVTRAPHFSLQFS